MLKTNTEILLEALYLVFIECGYEINTKYHKTKEEFIYNCLAQYDSVGITLPDALADKLDQMGYGLIKKP